MRQRVRLSSEEKPRTYANPLEATKALWEAVRVPNFETDPSPAAKALRDRLEELEREGERRSQKGSAASSATGADTLAEIQEVGGLMGAYYKEKLTASFSSPVLRDALPQIGAVFNFAFVAVILRLVLPRLLAIESMSDLEANLGFFGIPSRAEITDYIAQAGQLPLPVKLGGFVGIVVVEKVFCLTEFIPLGIILPTISPLLFGGLAQGVTASVLSSAAGATVNFAIGRRFLRDRVRTLSVFGSGPIGESAWFSAVNTNFEREGFKTALMLRLAPILPIPIDAHWYLCGATSLGARQFIAAQLLGSLKASFVDAYFGSLLMNELLAGRDAELPEQTKWVLCVEVVVIILTSVLVTNFATSTLDRLLREAGWDRSQQISLPFMGAAPAAVERKQPDETERKSP